MQNDKEKLLKWWYNRSINPYTNRKILKGKKVWNKLLKQSISNNIMDDIYHKYHGKLIDPMMKIKLDNNINFYKYEYCWDPLNGEILGKDPRGPLYFDPDILIHYFYINRLKYLWVKSENGFSGTYGEGVGIGPDFYIPGRGESYHWYLFRLPIFNAYCNYNKIGQQTTLSPILNFKDIKDIYNRSLKDKNRYYNLFKKERPNLIKIYELYHSSIQKPDYSNLNFFSIKEIKDNYTVLNINSIDKLRNLN